MTSSDEGSEAASWRERARAAARRAFFARRPGGYLARLVHDSVVDAGAAPAEHDLRFEQNGLTIRVHVVALNDHTALSGSFEPAESRNVVLHSSGPGPPLQSQDTEAGHFAFPPVGHGLVRVRMDAPDRPTVWSDWFRV